MNYVFRINRISKKRIISIFKFPPISTEQMNKESKKRKKLGINFLERP